MHRIEIGLSLGFLQVHTGIASMVLLFTFTHYVFSWPLGLVQGNVARTTWLGPITLGLQHEHIAKVHSGEFSSYSSLHPVHLFKLPCFSSWWIYFEKRFKMLLFFLSLFLFFPFSFLLFLNPRNLFRILPLNSRYRRGSRFCVVVPIFFFSSLFFLSVSLDPFLSFFLFVYLSFSFALSETIMKFQVDQF